MSVDYEVAWSIWQDMKKYGPMSRHVRRLIMDLVQCLDYDSVLDIGCGEGSLLAEICDTKANLRVCGTDVSETAIEAIAGRIDGKFIVADITNHYVDDQYDLVICSEVLEHIEEDVQALRNIRKMTGKYLLTVVPQGRMREFERNVGHVRNYTKAEMSNKLEQAGFRLIKFTEWGFPFYSPIYRSLLNRVPQQITTGSFGLTRKLFSLAVYYGLKLSSDRRGDILITLSRPIP